MQLIIIFLLFFLWRSLDFLIIFFSQKIIPYLGFFPYSDQLPGFNLPTWVSALANFDGLHYISIARDGYAQYEQAFFPLYPILIKYFSQLFSGNYLLTGLIISNISFLVGLFIFYKYLRLIRATTRVAPTTNFNEFQRISTIFLLLFFPTSFFFGAVYTEGLFFLLVITTLYSLNKKNYWLTAVFAFLASTTRLIGVFLIVPIIFHWLSFRKKGVINRAPTTKILTFLSPISGLVGYCFYLWQTIGDPFFFLTSQPMFGANRSAHLILLPQVYWRYLKIFFTASHDFRFYISIVEFLIFNFILIVLVLDLIKIINLKINKLKNFRLLITDYSRLGLNLFSLTNLIFSTLTGTFSSIPRYSLLSISFFIYFSQIKNSFIKYMVIIIFLILHVLLLGFFTQGYFIS